MANILNSPEIDKLATIIEESTRATEEGVKRFIEPAKGTLRRALSKRHHIIFGRRGSGKSSLLRKVAATLTVNRTPIAFIDLEKFKGHSYPDVLVSVLIVTFQEFKIWLDTAAINPAHKVSFWQKLFGSVPLKPAFNKKETAKLSEKLGNEIQKLNELLHSADEQNVKEVNRKKEKEGREFEVGGEISIPHSKVMAKSKESNKNNTSREVTQDYLNKKIDFLQRNIIQYQNIFRDMSILAKTDCYLFLDDLYHIRKSDQAKVLDYFHRIAKINNLWMKVGTIKHRTVWYIHGDPPVGMKLGDDCDQIDLDLTLEKYSSTKSFLIKILNGFLDECANIKQDQMINAGALDRLVLASGGVARDFLGIFRRSIDIASERAELDEEAIIFVEDINKAAGEYDDSKREELKRDTNASEDRTAIEKEFHEIQEFCLNSAKANMFLIDQKLKGIGVELIKELVDLRLIHLVRSRVTVSGKPGEIFEAYMLDVSQYAGARKKRGLVEIKFWDDSSKEHLRRVSLIYQPSK